MNEGEQLLLSPSSLNLYLECPRCFWLYKAQKIHRPRGPMSSLPSGLDLLIKKYFDRYRAIGKLPPEIEGKVKGELFENQEMLDNWRDWRKSLIRYEDQGLNAVLRGALDECFVLDGAYIPVDYKTRGFDLKKDSEKYYRNQLNCYTLLLEANGYQHLSFAYLLFYIPREVKEDGIIKFDIEPREVKTYPQEAKVTFEQAAKLLRGPAPPSDSLCEFCSWNTNRTLFK